jgi:hypothetical protein
MKATVHRKAFMARHGRTLVVRLLVISGAVALVALLQGVTFALVP